MVAFRVLLVTIFCAVVLYTAPVLIAHGPNLFAPFFSDMLEMGWPGQFNFDFMCMLLMSALYVAWRHQFSGPGLGLAVVAFFGGAPFLTAYLLYQSFQVQGGIAAVLVGDARLQALTQGAR